MDSLSIEEEL